VLTLQAFSYFLINLDQTFFSHFLKFHFIPAPKTIYRNVYKLPPGHFLVLKANESPRVREYWDVDFSARPGRSFDQARDELLELLEQSTACRMIADVPLGAFLSGGIDSSAIVALMAKASPTPVRTCTIGFADKRHDEAPFAREVAELFNTDHEEYQVSAGLQETVAILPRFFDEPFADSSAVPTYHVSRLARQAVTVALAGDGGDESFAGYDKYAVELKEDLVRRVVPRPLLALLNSLSGGWFHPAPRKLHSLTGSAMMAPARAFCHTNSYLDDQGLAALLADGLRRVCRSYDPAEITIAHYRKVAGADHVTRMLYTDLKTYLPDDILVKVDRMSMAHSLEVRAPFLDYLILDFAASLPSTWKIRRNDKKIILRQAFRRLLPGRILDRPKHGFTVPLDNWFRSEMKAYAEQALLHSEPLCQLLDPAGVRVLWDQHQSRKFNHGGVLWSLLMLALWQQEYQV